MNIANWLNRNTFHHSEFSDLPDLVSRKEILGLNISLCIPTLNEAETIGEEIDVFRHELQERYPLLDEIAVIDSGSTDNTLAVARSAGAEVFHSGDILPDHGFRRGKGENMWKAVYQLKGDIIVYIDADITNIHPCFVYGLVAPLICRPDILYVKAMYDRPLVHHAGRRPSGGGRVTEILVRPLFSLFIPELTAIIQPLSGEYAVRRNVLEELAFPVGYGVETAHLLDVYAKYGLNAFAQTDLDERLHRNRSIEDLGKTAFGILQTFFKRAANFGVKLDWEAVHYSLRQFEADGNEYRQMEYGMVEEERPPMIGIPEYLARHPERSGL
jgi:glucosyl-3-phosphoglycerate synthase